MAATPVPSSDVFYVDSYAQDLEPMGPNFGLLYDQIMNSFGVYSGEDSIEKRDQLSDTLTQLLDAVSLSGVIADVLHEIAALPAEMNTLSNKIFQLLVAALTSTAFDGFNITINTTEILPALLSSGVLQSTLGLLMLNDTNRDKLADDLGAVLVKYPWISALLNKIGAGKDLTVKLIADMIQTTVSKDPSVQNSTSLGKRASLSKRLPSLLKRDNSTDDYSGTLQAFLNNLVGSAIESQLLSSSLDSVLAAVNSSGIITPIAFLVLGDLSILNMIGFIGNKLYNLGVFDSVDLNKYYSSAKEKGLLSEGLQIVLTDPTYSPALAKIFHRFETGGTLHKIKLNLYGP